MKTLRFVCAYLKDSFKSRPFAYLLMVLSVVVGGVLSTALYGSTLMVVGDITRLYVPRYHYEQIAPDVLQTSEIGRIAEISERYDTRYYKNSESRNLRVMTSMAQDNASEDGFNEIYGNTVLLALSESNPIAQQDIDKAARVIVVSDSFALAYDKGVGDTISYFGAEYRIVGVSDVGFIIPYTAIAPDMQVVSLSYVFSPDKTLSDADDEFLTSLAQSRSATQIKTPITLVFMILAMAICAINVAVINKYLIRVSARRFKVAKMLGAKNGTVAACMLAEEILCCLVGAGVGVAIGIGILSSLAAMQSVAFGGLDVFILLASNIVITLVCVVARIAVRAKAAPCDSRV